MAVLHLLKSSITESLFKLPTLLFSLFRKRACVNAIYNSQGLTIKFTKQYNLSSTLDLVHGIRSQAFALYLAKREPQSCLLLCK